MPQAKAHNVSETGSVSLFPVKGCGGDPPMMCPLLSDRPSRTGTPPFCFSIGKGRHIQSPLHFSFSLLPEVMTRYQKISHISNNLTLSKTFNFEDAYHLKISQSSDHHWKRDYIVSHLTQDYSDVGQLTSEYGHEKMTLCHQVPQLSLSVGPTLPS